jgi:hypothetical protein
MPLGGRMQGARVMYTVGIIVLVGMALYFGFMAVDGFGLETRTASAVVKGKDYRPAGQTYTTQVINNRAYTTPHTTAEMHLLLLDLSGENAAWDADQRLYDELEAGDEVHVSYQRRRLTGALQVLNVSR